MYLNYSISHLFNLFIRNISKYTIYPFIVISCVILLFILLKNKDSYSKCIIIVIDIILSFIIIVNYKYNLLSTLTFKCFYHNLYFYFLNSLIFMIVNLVFILKNKYLKINIYFYAIQMIFLLFSLFMTYYLKNAYLLIIGNIYPEITIGNYIYFIYYIVIIFIFVYKLLTRNK